MRDAVHGPSRGRSVRLAVGRVLFASENEAMSCCKSCEEGKGCSGETATVPAGVIVPRELDVQTVIESPPRHEHEEEGPTSLPRLRSGKSIPVNDRLQVAHQESTASEPLAVGNCPRGSVDLVIFVMNSLTQVEAILQGGFDGENWLPISSTVFTAVGFARFRFERVAYRYLRLYYTATGSAGGVGVVATTLSGSEN